MNKGNILPNVSSTKSKYSDSLRRNTRRRLFLRASGLTCFDMPGVVAQEDGIDIPYLDPETSKVMETPDGRPFIRRRLYSPTAGRKYNSPLKGGIRVYFPPGILDALRNNPTSPVYITEGEKKAAKAMAEGIPCVGIGGIWNWKKEKGSNALHNDFLKIPNLAERPVVVVYDSDANDPCKKSDFDLCFEQFKEAFQSKGVKDILRVNIPHLGGKKTGLDDFLCHYEYKGDLPCLRFREFVHRTRMKAQPLATVLENQDFGVTTMMKRHFSPPKPYVRPWLTESSIILLYAKAGVGKTNFLLQMAAMLTREEPPSYLPEWWELTSGAGVMYVDGELPSSIFCARLKAIINANGQEESEATPFKAINAMDLYTDFGHSLNLTHEDVRNQLYRYFLEHPELKVIVLDNKVSLTPGIDENDAMQWSEINQWLISLRGIGKTVILVHHANKSDGLRGTSHLEDNVDVVMKLEGKSGSFKVSFEKHRNFSAHDARSANFRICSEGELTDKNAKLWVKPVSPEEAKTSSGNSRVSGNKDDIERMLLQGTRNKDVLVKLKANATIVSQVRKRMVAEGLLVSSQNPKDAPVPTEAGKKRLNALLAGQ